jgi:hypothetical protein
MTRAIECRCEYDFTCGHCLSNAKPWFWTGESGVQYDSVPADFCQPSEAKRERANAYLRSCAAVSA